eukprot:CAMPEP_0118971828 /NCGR_PEP_ID=MMETSP1173-20130426/8344_1 /TAXON_ID=1034831 /ORGANISM="Rhizochromulina marina cf, Strain CCMP1243" /LENGTH=142 /DNA_ID=CAMNT_0006921327 /DNA_START=49 /DNA_END=477 /DNA_ORIENTATION=+
MATPSGGSEGVVGAGASASVGAEEWAAGSGEPAKQAVDIVAFLKEVEGYTPTIPEEVIRYYLQRGGSACDEHRTLKLVSLATDKLISEVVHEAKSLAELRSSAGEGTDAADPSQVSPRPVLTMGDLAESLKRKGVKITKPSS